MVYVRLLSMIIIFSFFYSCKKKEREVKKEEGRQYYRLVTNYKDGRVEYSQIIASDVPIPIRK